MKKIILLLLAFTNVGAQTTLEHSYPAKNAYGQLSYVRLSSSGDKYMLYDPIMQEVSFYNLNHSLWKSILLPTPNGYKLGGLFSISDNLFDSDNGLELMYSYYQSTVNVYNSEMKIMNEDYSTELLIPNCHYGTVTKMGNSWKLLVTIDSANKTSSAYHHVYSLSGSLPLSAQQNGATEMTTTGLYPNPSDGKCIIEYSLKKGNRSELLFYDDNGKEVKRFVVDGNFSTLEIDNSDLPPGSYFYKLSSESQSDGKKMVIIK